MLDIEDHLPSWQAAPRRRLPWLRLGLCVAVAVTVLAAGTAGVLVVSVDRAAQPTASPAPAAARAEQLVPLAEASAIFPPVLRAKYGDHYWAVFLAVTRTLEDPRQAAAEQQALAAGYAGRDLVLTSVSCQAGAREDLARGGMHLDSAVDYAALVLRFGTRQQADDFVDAYQPGVVATVLVTWSCTG